jgi:hypothetical protein
MWSSRIGHAERRPSAPSADRRYREPHHRRAIDPAAADSPDLGCGSGDTSAQAPVPLLGS